MNKFLSLLILNILFTFCFYANNNAGFIENKGQVVDFDNKTRTEFLFYTKTEKLDIYFRKKGITYIFKKGESFPKNIGLTKEDEDKIMNEFLNSKTFFYRLDLDFVNSNTNYSVSGVNKNEFYYNYYQAHCPDGILNVSSFNKISYKDVYQNIDFEFYIKDGKFKYDIIVKPNAKISDIGLKYNGSEKVSIVNNELKIQSPVGEIIETLPRSYVVDEAGKEIDLKVKYELKNDEIIFKSKYIPTQLLVIDPQISWTTYYDGSFWTGAYANVDAKGTQFVVSSSGANVNFPTLNPGGGAYYQNSTAGSGDFQLVQFNTNGVLNWATFYGGTAGESTTNVKLDYLGNIYLVGNTNSPNIPTQNAGGYFDNTFNPYTYIGATFIIKFNSTGIRQWATYYDYVSGTKIDVDKNNNLYVVGNSNDNNPPVLNLAGAYNQATVANNTAVGPSAGKSIDMFIVKFNASTTRLWATNLGGSSDEGVVDVKCGDDGFLNILASAGNNEGAGIITQNAGGYLDNILGNAGTDKIDALIYRFNTAGALFWGTAFGGSENETIIQRGRITTDSNNNIYVYGETKSPDITTVNPGGGAYFDNTFNVTGGATSIPFILKFNSATNLIWSTYFGSYGYGTSAYNFSSHIGVNSQDNLILITTDGGGPLGTFPLVNRVGDYNSALNASPGVYIAEFNNNLNIAWSTYYVGNTDRNTLGDAVIHTGGCGYEIYMVSNWESYATGAIDPTWVNPGSGAYHDITFNSSNSSGLITRFSNAVTTSTINPTICSGANYTLPNGSVVSAEGVYTNTLTSVGGCDSIITINLTSISSFSLSSLSSTICSGSIYTITPSSAGTYTLLPDNITGSSFTVSPSVSTVYTVSAGSGTCTSSVTQTVVVNSADSPTITVSSSTLSCGSSATLTVSGATTYTWSTGETTSSIVVTPTVNTTYTVLSGSGTCTSSATQLITVGSITTPTITASSLTVSCGSSATITANGVATYTWNTGEITASIVVTPTANTTYTVLSGSGTCTSSVTQLITVGSITTPTITTSSSTLSCGSSATLTASGATTYTWSTGETTPSIVVTPTSNTTYTVLSGIGVCASSTTQTLVVNSIIIPSITVSSSTVSCGSSATLTASGGATYTWSTGETSPSIVVTPISSTTYTVVSATGNCISSATQVITEINSLQTLTISANVTITAGSQTPLTVYGNGSSYVWSPSLGLSCTTCTNPIANPLVTTNYCVLSSIGTCTTQACILVIVDVNCDGNKSYDAPNAFSPNGDGVNDEFCLQGWKGCVSNFYIRIYNRWGNLVFESSDENFCWDGKYQGKLLDAGVFVYYIQAEASNKGKVTKKGNITLIK